MPDRIRYRTEAFSGQQERDAAEVMAFETFVLGNSDILECLADTILKGRPICGTMYSFIEELKRNGFIDDMGVGDQVAFFQGVLKEIEEVTGFEIKCALWLADKDTVIHFYGRDMLHAQDYDAYKIGDIVLSELGYDGTLYGYTEMPAPLSQHEIEAFLAPKRAESDEKASLDAQLTLAATRASGSASAPTNNVFKQER